MIKRLHRSDTSTVLRYSSRMNFSGFVLLTRSVSFNVNKSVDVLTMSYIDQKFHMCVNYMRQLTRSTLLYLHFPKRFATFPFWMYDWVNSRKVRVFFYCYLHFKIPQPCRTVLHIGQNLVFVSRDMNSRCDWSRHLWVKSNLWLVESRCHVISLTKLKKI